MHRIHIALNPNTSNMVRKNFSGGLNSLLGEAQITEHEAEQEKIKEVRTTIYLPQELADKIKCLAYWDRITIKEIVTSSLQATISEYEKNQGKPISRKG